MGKVPIPTLVRAECAAQRPAPERRVRDLRDGDLVAIRNPFVIEFAEQSTADTSPSGLVLASWYQKIPAYASAMLYRLQFEAFVSAGQGEAWIVDDLTGTEDARIPVTGTSYTLDGVGPTKLRIDPSWINTRRLIVLRGRHDGGGVIFTRNQNRATCWFEDDAGA